MAQVGEAVDVLVLDTAVVLAAPAAFARTLPAIRRIFVFAPVGMVDDVRRVLDGRPLELVTTPFSPALVERRVREVVAELA